MLWFLVITARGMLGLIRGSPCWRDWAETGSHELVREYGAGRQVCLLDRSDSDDDITGPRGKRGVRRGKDLDQRVRPFGRR